MALLVTVAPGLTALSLALFEVTSPARENEPVAAGDAGVIRARPTSVTQAAPTGIQPLDPAARRPGLLVVPDAYTPGHPSPLLVLLHGAGGTARGTAELFGPLARALPRAILVIPESHAPTWDVIASRLGPDASALNAALVRVFARYAIDPQSVAVAGFSDGASYALTLGLANGGLFGDVLAFSPGFEAAPVRRGQPRIFVSHGASDRVLPVDVTSRDIVPRLIAAGYDVTYREFEGGHSVPPSVQSAAAAWFAGPRPGIR